MKKELRPLCSPRDRITVSAVFGILCVLLIALWVRSYWAADRLKLDYAVHVEFQSGRGKQLIAVIHDAWNRYSDSRFKSDPRRPWDWTLETRPLRDPTGKTLSFWWRIDADGFEVIVPHWFLIVASVASALLPWVKWSTRFSLRTLLIVTTLVAGLLGLLVIAL